MGIERLANIEITDEDILWVEDIMGGGIHFDSVRAEVIKKMNSVDVQAFPGSGKTTILVAKLAILARKWSNNNAGICVLSHTNVAREEIENRLGNTEIGHRLLSYPHFIGTVHSFFDTYVALPWLKSKVLLIGIRMVQQKNSCCRSLKRLKSRAISLLMKCYCMQKKHWMSGEKCLVRFKPGFRYYL